MLDAFPEIAGALRELPDAVLDGELVVPDVRGRSDFEELRRRNLLQRPRMIAEAAALRPAVFVVFDVLELGGNDVRDCPLLERRVLLHQHVAACWRADHEHVEQHGEALFRAIAADDHEGIVAKCTGAPYRPWQAAPLDQDQEQELFPARGR
jgi:bifunctional non-homologous end joining protein LigD